jgi:hypothetical protein
MKKLLVSMSMVVAMVFAGCKEDEEEQPLFTVDTTAIEVAAGGGEATIAVTSNLTWFVAGADAAWCTVSPVVGEGDGTVQLHVAENPALTPRTTTVTISAGDKLNKTVTVTQAASGVTLWIDETAVGAPIAGGNYMVAVTSNTAWTVAVSAGATWCAVYPESGEGDGTVRISVAKNPTLLARAATVTLTAGALIKTVAVTQEGVTPTLWIDNTPVNASTAGGNYMVAVISNTTWTVAVSAGATWCTVSPAVGEGNGTVRVNIAENPTLTAHAASITIAAGAIIETVAVTQEATAPMLLVDKNAIFADGGGGTYEVAVTGNTSWTLLKDAAATWCAVSPESGEGDGTVQVIVAKNLVVVARATTFTISNGTDDRTVTVTQEPRPFYAASAKVWTYNVTWSDAIQMPGCNKEANIGGDEPQCRSYTYGNRTYYYYNFAYIYAYKDEMCPSPWIAPFAYYYNNLILDPGFNVWTIQAEWGVGGYARGTGVNNLNEGYYWSANFPLSGKTLALHYSGGNAAMENLDQQYGMQFRCYQLKVE